ncbi:hypothetical protein Pr1d_04900 [Bythopirellula goksoeyrii]|uniref:Uncharacterized protein n=2 Tax=Bythopirellula goksoeyrii TaxID=1400387 RepID=A0A5B9Q696_9BACT|nr:hypothetical protein Pr1d_04900 [Bythopirellula goksoeyrii]
MCDRVAKVIGYQNTGMSIILLSLPKTAIVAACPSQDLAKPTLCMWRRWQVYGTSSQFLSDFRPVARDQMELGDELVESVVLEGEKDPTSRDFFDWVV